VRSVLPCGTHRITLIFVAFWCIIWCFDANKKPCKLLICRVLAPFGIVFCSLEWQNLELFSQGFEAISELLGFETSNFYVLIFNRLNMILKCPHFPR